MSVAQVGPLYVEPGAPWENGHAESFHSKLRDEFLACKVFESGEGGAGAGDDLACVV